MKRSPAICLLALLTIICHERALASDDFRIETDIYAEGQSEPILQTLTLFTQGVVYDFLKPGLSEITTFEPERGRFVLLDSQRRIKTTVTTEQILEFTALMRANVDEKQQRELIAPKFKTAWDQSSGWLTLTSDSLVYQAKGQLPKFASAVERYQQFADWYARLNAMHPSNLPPFGRIELNEAVAAKGLIPHEIVRTVTVTGALGPRDYELRSRHLPVWTLSATDRERIDLVGRYKAEFEEVPFQKFRHSE